MNVFITHSCTVKTIELSIEKAKTNDRKLHILQNGALDEIHWSFILLAKAVVKVKLRFLALSNVGSQKQSRPNQVQDSLS